MTIASWNVNSVRARMPVISKWLESADVDVLLFQETKVEDLDFPAMEFSALGFPHIATLGQKSYNGVAILSRLPLRDVQKHLPGEKEATEARLVSATIAGIRMASVYAPNGNPPTSEKFIRKMDFMGRLAAHTGNMLASGQDFILAGDFNVIPEDFDAATPARWKGDALMHPDTRAAWRQLCFMGLTDAWRTLHPETPGYTFWDYQGGAWQKNDGIRIDHALLSPRMADRLISCEVDKTPRGMEKASDHTPLLISCKTP
ncbi:MAG TPA: exodeoxyribonuclease III [Rhodospirillaceae bacterium]|nr:MAG: exodeoxyribonuclease III [Alphaproteobacteria bacterium GWF2_58_20]HAU29365.1 exodeoxyribonuclease III [Rhodospirillaceae bacterium]